MADSMSSSTQKPIRPKEPEKMDLDSATMKYLALVPGTEGDLKHENLYKCLNLCKTVGGSELLQEWIENPLLDIDEIKYRQDLVTVFVRKHDLRKKVREDILPRIPDLNAFLRALESDNPSILVKATEAYWIIVHLSFHLTKVLEALERDDGIIWRCYSGPLEEIIELSSFFVEDIAPYVDLEEVTTRFIHPSILARPSQIGQLRLHGYSEENNADALVELSTVLAGYRILFELTAKAVAELDVITCFAHLAVDRSYIKPTLSSHGDSCILKGSKHPLIEVIGGDECIDNDVSLVRHISDFNILTGPKSSGKSTFLRQVGITIVMAQIGCYVPCKEARLVPFQNISVICSVENPESHTYGTFGSEVIRCAGLIQNAKEDSLVLIDELASTLDETEDIAFAHAFSEYIMQNMKAFTLFSTHIHELTDLSTTHGNVQNLCTRLYHEEGKAWEMFSTNLQINRSTATPNYRVFKGVFKEDGTLSRMQQSGLPNALATPFIEATLKRKRNYLEEQNNPEARNRQERKKLVCKEFLLELKQLNLNGISQDVVQRPEMINLLGSFFARLNAVDTV